MKTCDLIPNLKAVPHFSVHSACLSIDCELARNLICQQPLSYFLSGHLQSIPSSPPRTRAISIMSSEKNPVYSLQGRYHPFESEIVLTTHDVYDKSLVSTHKTAKPLGLLCSDSLSCLGLKLKAIRRDAIPMTFADCIQCVRIRSSDTRVRAALG